MRKINKIIIHCSDTRTNQRFTIEDIRSWHLKRGFVDVGYHWYIDLDGNTHKGRDISRVGAHCKGQNSNSIGICFEGGKTPNLIKWNSPNELQLKAFDLLIKEIQVELGKSLPLHGHYEYSSKTCPNFDVNILK